MTEPHVKNLRDGKLILFEGKQWEASKAYSVDDVVVPAQYNGYAYKCTTAGTSGTAEPEFPTTIDETETDGTGALVWTCQALNEVEVDFIEDGGLSAEKPKNLIYVRDRGTIRERREGNEEPVALSFEIKYRTLRGESGDAVTIPEAITKTGNAAAWNSSRPAHEPYSVNVLAMYLDSLKGKYECVQYSGFATTKDPLPSEGDEYDTIAVEGEAIGDPEIWWEDIS